MLGAKADGRCWSVVGALCTHCIATLLDLCHPRHSQQQLANTSFVICLLGCLPRPGTAKVMSPEQLASTRVEDLLQDSLDFYRSGYTAAQEKYKIFSADLDKARHEKTDAQAALEAAEEQHKQAASHCWPDAEQLCCTAAERLASARKSAAAMQACYEQLEGAAKMQLTKIRDLRAEIQSSEAAIAAFSNGLLGSWTERARNAARTDTFAVGIVLAELLGLRDDAVWHHFARVDHDPGQNFRAPGLGMLHNYSLDANETAMAIQEYVHEVSSMQSGLIVRPLSCGLGYFADLATLMVSKKPWVADLAFKLPFGVS